MNFKAFTYIWHTTKTDRHMTRQAARQTNGESVKNSMRQMETDITERKM